MIFPPERKLPHLPEPGADAVFLCSMKKRRMLWDAGTDSAQKAADCSAAPENKESRDLTSFILSALSFLPERFSVAALHLRHPTQWDSPEFPRPPVRTQPFQRLPWILYMDYSIIGYVRNVKCFISWMPPGRILPEFPWTAPPSEG